MPHPAIAAIRGGLVVSCQALPGEPLHVETGGVMPLLARAAVQSGAVGIRTSTARDVAEVLAAVDVPVIGLTKVEHDGFAPFITSTLDEVLEIADAGAHVVAFDATDRERADGRTLAQLVADARAARPGVALMADVATLAEGVHAAELGVDVVGTTLNGYTEASMDAAVSNLDLVRQLVERVDVPVVAEGRIHTPGDARAMLDAGAASVVVGGAITRPHEITARFVDALR